MNGTSHFPLRRYFAGVAAGLAILLPLSEAAAAPFAYPRYGMTQPQRDTLQWLWIKAQKFSGIASRDGPDGYLKIPVYRLTKKQMGTEVCPENPQDCETLGGLYDTTHDRILLRADLTPERNIIDASFLLHEYVHRLQKETQTEAQMFGTCTLLQRTELQAYDAQNKFLKSEGEFFRAGVALRFMICGD